ncbi:MAG: hypothetical protein HKN31_11055 [Pricia sp.]|nr:hypothetical protein [Pricia sp.]
MEAHELKQLLAAYDRKLDHTLRLNETVLKNMNLEKSKGKMRTVLIYRIVELVSFAILALVIGNYLVSNWIHIHLALSGSIIGIFTLIALSGSIGQVVLLQQIDFSKPLVEIREKVELVNAHGLLFIKLLFLSAPIWWAYAIVAIDIFLDIDFYLYLEPNFVVRYLILNALLLIPIIWAFNKLTHKNLHISWVRKTIEFLSGRKTTEALEFLNEIEEFKK